MAECAPLSREGVFLSVATVLARPVEKPGRNVHCGRQSRRSSRIIGETTAELWDESANPQERELQLGKVQNLRVAARSLHGLEIPPGKAFSFWRQLGRPSRAKGYAIGRELREGCLIPTVAGGLCQLSSAIYNAALAAGLEIVERHAHSHPGVGLQAQENRDATVFWNYVDLRLRGDFAWRLEVSLSHDHLRVRIRSSEARRNQDGPEAPLPAEDRHETQQPNSCITCGTTSCFRQHTSQRYGRGTDGQAVVVDEWWPEWQAYLKDRDFRSALLCRPLNGRRFRKTNYQWDEWGFAQVTSATMVTLRRAWAVRRLREQGAARQRALLEWDRRLAREISRNLKAQHRHLVVSQNLLPYLWSDGVLGGRTFDVFMVRLPFQELHAELDRAAALHPEAKTCADFRAPDELVVAEMEALTAATQWITPHARIAQIGGPRSVRLPWVTGKLPAKPRHASRRVAFPASTLCRKGSYELREVARALDLEVVCLGNFLEGADFWSGIRLAPPAAGSWLEGIGAVVLPSFVEHRPRRLLQAIGAGTPVVASSACGLHGLSGVVEVTAGKVDELITALRPLVSPDQTCPLETISASRLATAASPVVPS